MKKIIQIIILTCFLKTVNAQYGQKLFSHTGFSVTDAAITNVNSKGFVRAGYKLTSSPGSTLNFFVEKGDTLGIVSGATEFSRNFSMVEADPTCSFSLNPLTNCSGVSVVEIAVPSTVGWYAICGGFNKGVFFSTLGSTGIPNITNSYLFPYTPTLTTKPILLQSISSPNEFYISGSCDSNMYVLKVNSFGALLWSSFYHSGSMIPNAMIENPYNGDLVVVGNNIPALSYSIGPQAFFLGLDKNTGNISNYITYGDSPCHRFSSISVATSTTGGNGFILGGESDPYTTYGGTWFVKIGVTGNVIWSTLVEPAMGYGGGAVTDVIERFDPVLNSYTYYGLTTNVPFGIIVLKLGDTGIPAPGNNHFIYNTGAPNWSAAASLTSINTGSNAGLQIHGTGNAITKNNYLFISADFNGESTCTQTLTTIYRYEAGATATITPWLIKEFTLTPCSGFILNHSPVVSNYTTCMIPTTISEFNNFKPGTISVYPNPSNDVINIATEHTGLTEIEISNYLGQKVLVIPYSEKINISSLAKGFYIIKIKDAIGNYITSKFLKE